MKKSINLDDITFLSKIVNIKSKKDDEVVIKVQEVDNSKMNVITTANKDVSIFVLSAQKKLIFENEFLIRDPKSFVDNIIKYGEFEETEDEIIFSNDLEKFIYKKRESNELPEYKLPSKKDYKKFSKIVLNHEEMQNFIDIFNDRTNEFSDYISFIIENNVFKIKIGKKYYENIYTKNIKIFQEDNNLNNLIFLSVFKDISKIFKSINVDKETKYIFYLDSDLIVFIEDSSINFTKYYIGSTSDIDGE